MCDASFIGLAKVLEAPLKLAKPGAKLVALIKPQFEAGREEVGKGGVVRDAAVARARLRRSGRVGRVAGLGRARRDREPDHRPEGNVEYLARRDKDLAGESGIVAPPGVADWRASPYLARAKGRRHMQSENKMFDDMVKMVNGFAGTVAGMGREAESSAREKMREWIGGQRFRRPRRVRGGQGDGRRRARRE